MEFRNTLIMSVLLVAGFVCLHFYEEDVRKEHNAFETAFTQAIEDKKMSIYLFDSYTEGGRKCESNYKSEIIELNNDFDQVIAISETPKSLELESSKQLLEQYGIEFRSSWKLEGLPRLYEYQIIDQIADQMHPLYMDLKKCSRFHMKNNIDLIIDDLKSTYVVNQDHSIGFTAVGLHHSFPMENLYLDVDGVRQKIDVFPVKLDYFPNQIAFQGKFENPTTGETYTLNEKYSPKEIIDFP